MTYEEKVVEGIKGWFASDDSLDFIRGIALDGTTVTVTFYDQQSDSIRNLAFDIYERELNMSGSDYPEAVGALIAVQVYEEAAAVRKD